MNKSRFRVYLRICCLSVILSCSDDNEEDLFGSKNFFCDPDLVTFSDIIKPIIDTNCTVSGCHVIGTGLPDFTQFSNIKTYAAEIRERTSTRDMPRGGRVLTSLQIAQIGCWVESGALNN
ncbi:MAG TPA: hypothetical protein VGA21_00105 [Cyclobacteriaceae bacterium]